MPQSDEARLQRVLGDLRPERAAARGFGAPHPVADRMAQTATPGLVLSVIDDFAVAGSRACGVRDAATADPVAPDTLFQAASISKVVFAVAVMRLVQDGQLDLDAAIDDDLTAWHLPAQDGWRPRITLRQLLSHTAGTTVHGFKGYPVTAPRPSLIEVLDGARPANSPPVVVDLLPGWQTRYSGGGTSIAQQVVVERTGRSLPELMRALVLDPLGMRDSTFEQPLPDGLAARAATGHPWNGVALAGRWHVYPETAAAGLWTTARDLAGFGAAVMAALRGRGSALGLAPETVAAMVRPVLPDHQPGDDFIGLGWFCASAGDRFRFGHPGSNEGFIAELRCLPATGQGAVVMLNANQGDMLRGEILAAVGREYGWPDSTPLSSAEHAGAAYAGRYVGAPGVSVEIAAAADGGLLFTMAPQPPLRLRCIGDAIYSADAIKLRVRFAPADAAMTLIQESKTVRLIRETSS
ncbi:MAG: serine hydrolase domain-containing protein [Pseudomonadota bacterium]